MMNSKRTLALIATEASMAVALAELSDQDEILGEAVMRRMLATVRELREHSQEADMDGAS